MTIGRYFPLETSKKGGFVVPVAFLEALAPFPCGPELCQESKRVQMMNRVQELAIDDGIGKGRFAPACSAASGNGKQEAALRLFTAAIMKSISADTR
jgi:hypothetical protein